MDALDAQSRRIHILFGQDQAVHYSVPEPLATCIATATRGRCGGITGELPPWAAEELHRRFAALLEVLTGAE